MTNKKIVTIIGLGLFSFTLIGCEMPEKNTSDNELSKKQETIMKEANSQIWMPAITNFQERKLAKMIFELRDKADLQTYTYITAKYNGELKFLCDSIGYGLPYSVQYTNPDKLVDVTDYGIDSYQANDSATVSQADPNGLFMPEGLSATWVMCIDDKGDAKPVYVENEIIVSPIKLK